MSTRCVAIVGAGNMGGAMAARLLEQGWQVRVRDLEAGKMAALAQLGAAACESPAAAARGAQALIVCVVDAAQTEAVLFGPHGAAANLAAGCAVLLCPTIAPADVERIAARLQAAGMDPIDAPMSGGPARARDGSMSLMVACGEAAFERNAALIGALSNRGSVSASASATVHAPSS